LSQGACYLKVRARLQNNSACFVTKRPPLAKYVLPQDSLKKNTIVNSECFEKTRALHKRQDGKTVASRRK